MSIKTRIISTIFAGTLVIGAGMAATPASAAVPGPQDIKNPTHCTHGCGGGGFDGPHDLTNPTGDPGDGGDPGVDVPIPADATFTG